VPKEASALIQVLPSEHLSIGKAAESRVEFHLQISYQKGKDGLLIGADSSHICVVPESTVRRPRLCGQSTVRFEILLQIRPVADEHGSLASDGCAQTDALGFLGKPTGPDARILMEFFF
jgi:hypothetical protein